MGKRSGEVSRHRNGDRREFPPSVTVSSIGMWPIVWAPAHKEARPERGGLASGLPGQIAHGLMAHDALGAHARDELGISETLTARPLQAALASAATFMAGAALPLQVVLVTPAATLPWTIAGSAGGAPILRAAARVTFWGALAMALTVGVRSLFGTVA